MLKITHFSIPADPVTRLRVEGRIVLRTASEVANACHAALADGAPVLLDLGGVAFVDPEGAAALAALERRNVTIVGCSPFIGALLRSHTATEEGRERRDDASLVRRARSADPAAFEEVVRRHGKRLLALAKRLLRDEDRAHAAVRDGFRAAADDFAALTHDTDLEAWLARRVAAAALRRGDRRERAPEPALDASLPRFDDTGHWAGGERTLPALDEIREAGALRASIGRCLDRLPESSRLLIALRDVEGFDVDIVAGLLGTTAGAVRFDLHRARQALHASLATELATHRAANETRTTPLS